jgi:hypothetical protein
MDRVDRKLEFLQVASEGILEQTGGALDEQRHLGAALADADSVGSGGDECWEAIVGSILGDGLAVMVAPIYSNEEMGTKQSQKAILER